MKVLLLGATGMLGSAVYNVLRDKYDLTITARDKDKLNLLGSFTTYASLDGIGEWQKDSYRFLEFDAEKMMADYTAKKGSAYFSEFVKIVGDVDYVINAVGVTIPFSLKNPALTFFVNSALPHILARQYGPRLIHITTDCVYSGTDGKAPYDENSALSPVDIYGLSKSLGEPKDCLTIRTSIIGLELSGNTGLLGWFLSTAAPTATLNGFTDHFWNGITTHQFGVVCDKIMSAGRLDHGLFHVFANPVSKYEMLLAFKERFNRQCEIKPASGNPVVRTLGTVYGLNDWLEIPTFQKMIEEIQ
jgi:dTDP-4-dehydrorhamnose reductase